jgi:hypothetical protein
MREQASFKIKESAIAKYLRCLTAILNAGVNPL